MKKAPRCPDCNSQMVMVKEEINFIKASCLPCRQTWTIDKTNRIGERITEGNQFFPEKLKERLDWLQDRIYWLEVTVEDLFDLIVHTSSDCIPLEYMEKLNERMGYIKRDHYNHISPMPLKRNRIAQDEATQAKHSKPPTKKKKELQSKIMRIYGKRSII